MIGELAISTISAKSSILVYTVSMGSLGSELITFTESFSVSIFNRVVLPYVSNRYWNIAAMERVIFLVTGLRMAFRNLTLWLQQFVAPALAHQHSLCERVEFFLVGVAGLRNLKLRCIWGSDKRTWVDWSDIWCCIWDGGVCSCWAY